MEPHIAELLEELDRKTKLNIELYATIESLKAQNDTLLAVIGDHLRSQLQHSVPPKARKEPL